jgi:hypothetical protein
MTMEAFREETKPLLRPNQVAEMEDDIRRIGGELNAPPFIANQIRDKSAKRKQLQQITRDLETQRPQPYSATERDAVAKRHDELLEQVKTGMPTQAEMRRRPPGAVDKHMGWERRNKAAILELKNIRLRMHATGMIDNVGDASEVANIERFRPAGGAQELAMDGALIQGRQFHLPPPGAAPAAVMSDEQRETLAEHAPEILEKMALLSNEDRATILGMVDDLIGGVKKPKEPKPRKPHTPSAYQLLQQEAGALGINSFGMKADQLRAAVAAKRAED